VKKDDWGSGAPTKTTPSQGGGQKSRHYGRRLLMHLIDLKTAKQMGGGAGKGHVCMRKKQWRDSYSDKGVLRVATVLRKDKSQKQGGGKG